MLDKLSETLKRTTDRITNAIFLDKNLVNSIVKDLQRALIEADVNVALVLKITKKIKEEALSERLKGVEKKEHIIKLLHDELISLLGEKREIKLKKSNTFMMLGLYGAGKTTSIGKLAQYYAKRGNKVCAIGLDVHRPAASEQLKQLMDKMNLPAVSTRTRLYFFRSSLCLSQIFFGDFSSGEMNAGRFILSINCFNCSEAAGRWTSRPIAQTLFPLYA